MKRLNKKGFTLVELLAVIVILALLMVVAASSIGGVQDSAKKKALETEAKKIVSKAYEDIQGHALDSTTYTNFTYKGESGADVTIGTGEKVFKDGNYTIHINVISLTDSTKPMGTVCIDDGSKHALGTIAGSSVNITEAYGDKACADSTKAKTS